MTSLSIEDKSRNKKPLEVKDELLLFHFQMSTLTIEKKK